jgi:uncharacterized membrane protein YozB (DUF420 family)
MSIKDLPVVDAGLNSLSAVFLAAGYYFIKKKNQTAHRNCMVAAFVTSVIFLACYLTYHFNVGTTRFLEPPWFRPIYLAILIPHEILAMLIVPLILITLNRAFREKFDAHRRIAKWTWPLWMYVSVTGVLLYYLLYIKFPQR